MRTPRVHIFNPVRFVHASVIYLVLFILSTAHAAVTFDAVTGADSGATNPATTLDFSHTVGVSAGNRILIVGLTALDQSGGLVPDCGSVTYAGAALTRLSRGVSDGNGSFDGELWYRIDPATGSNTVAIDCSADGRTDRIAAGAISFYGVHQSSPFGTVVTLETGITTTPSVTVAGGTTDDVIISILYTRLNEATTATPGETSRWDEKSAAPGTDAWSAGSTTAGTGSNVVMDWTLNAATARGLIGVAIKAAPQASTPAPRIISQ